MTAEQQKEENKSMTVGQKIKYFRKRKGYTQKEVGELLGFRGYLQVREWHNTKPECESPKVRH